MAPRVTDALIAHMRTSRRTLFSIPHIPLKGPTAEALRAAAKRNGFWTVAERQMRPILYPDMAAGIAEFDRMVSSKRRHELERQLRRLCEAGAVSFMWARTATEIEAAFNMFIALEAAGWKGRRGTALAKRQERAGLRPHGDHPHGAERTCRQSTCCASARNRLPRLSGSSTGGLSIPWKVAFDETFAAFSPGKQLMCDETRRWLADPKVDRVDPVCEEDNPLMAPLWPERDAYGTLLISSRRWGIGARFRAAMADLTAFGKANVKTLLRSKPGQGAKPAARRSRAKGGAKRSRQRS